MSPRKLLALAAMVVGGAVSAGCTTGAYCFRDCEDTADGGGTDGPTSDVQQEALIDSGDACQSLFGCSDASDASDAEACVKTNGGIEICDGIDNDCNGQIDEESDGGISYSSPATCGTCANNCEKKIANAEAAKCVLPDAGGAGTCDYTVCSPDYYDLNNNRTDGCEYFCIKAVVGGNPVTDETDPSVRCNAKDDDCDGQVDEDVDVCADVLNCGTCGRTCVVPNGSPQCEHTGTAACDTTNTVCKIKQCDAGWVDLDKNYATGCEYQCAPTNGGVEICDNLDNDCDGLIDQFDPDLNDPAVGVTCQGGTKGICADPSTAGKTACHNGVVKCEGANVVTPGQVVETCNAKDDDCNGFVDDNPTGQGNSCGSGVGNCVPGQKLCQNGAFACVGAVGPQTETCNGQDDDCNGLIDDNPTDAGGTCGLGTAPCKAGKQTCVAGTLACVGAITPQPEICDGVDNDCNGIVDDNAPGEGNPCGSSVGACTAGAKHCVGGTFVCQGGTTGTTEICDGIDNDCNGIIDDNPTGQNAPCGSPNVGTCKQGLNKCQNGSFVCVGSIGPTAEICDNLDNDCNGTIDDNTPNEGAACGITKGACKAGTQHCQAGTYVCQGAINASVEVCNGVDDDCNGTVDDNVTGNNAPCGSSVGNCVAGVQLCTAGAFVCTGKIGPQPEVCNGQDDDCDGTVDNAPTDVGGACNVPPAAPAGATEPCKAGVYACTSGVKVCQGSVIAQGSTDTCGVDTNCDGVYNGPTASQLQTDPKNCGTCGHDCTAQGQHGIWGCAAGACALAGCQPGWFDANKNAADGCEYACTFTSAIEVCNGVDDNCDGTVDEMKDGTHPNGVIAPTPTQVCGVSPLATEAACTGVPVTCVAGKWNCAFAAGYCDKGTPAACSTTPDICDTKDNNCNGAADEPYKHPVLASKALGDVCASDDSAPGTQGVCRTTGTYTCATTTSTGCSATKDTSKVAAEACDGQDNDCDGSIDEPFNAKGSNATYFVKPAVTKIAAALWVYSYEASRPTATASTPGSGDGYYCNSGTCPGGAPVAPAGVTLDKTPACSASGAIPWFNVTPIEAEQTCNARGGVLCSTAQWQTSCLTNPPGATTCKWGYAPNGAACTTALGPPYAFPFPSSAAKWCNLGPTFDFNTSSGGDQDGLLPTASSLLSNCYADWAALLSNGTANGKIYDLTGNLREITKAAVNSYPLMGGAFNTQDEAGATCGFTFYTVDQNFQLYDVGFRCCFTSDPTL